MLIDTHAHVNFRSFKDDAKETLQRALDNGVSVINVGSQIDTSRQAVELADQMEQLTINNSQLTAKVYAVVGLHPEHTHSQYVDEEETHFLSREEKFDYNLYKELAKHPRVVGIGECGLDYYRLPEDKNLHKEIKQKQKDAFRLQIKLAQELDKVLVIHSRPEKGNNELFEDMLKILDEEIAITPSNSPFEKGENGPAPLLAEEGQGEVFKKQFRFEIHSFTGSPQYAQKFLDRGAYMSFNGIITFDKTGNMEKLVQLCPMDRLILETDCPYLSPVPMRGKRNEPMFVKYVEEKVAQIKGLSFETVESQTSQNAKRLFHLT